MSEETFRVALADDDSQDRIDVRHMLEKLGHKVVSEAKNGQQLVEQVAISKPDVVVTDLHMPVLDGLQAADAIAQKETATIVVMSGSHASTSVKQSLQRNNIFGYITKPFAAGMLDGAMRFAVGLFGRFRDCEDKVSALQKSLEDRKSIEKAKGLLMKALSIDEPEAHRKLQKMASSKNQKLPEMAESLLKNGLSAS